MNRGDVLREQLKRRIRNSEISLDVHYPPLRTAATIADPELGPSSSPLTGPKPTNTLIPGVVTSVKDPVEGVKCLWLDAVVTTLKGSERVNTELNVGWLKGAEAVARVLVEDAALDAAGPYAGTIFDNCEVVVAQGKRWRVMGVEPIGSSFSAPFTYAVWLTGSLKD